MSMSTKELLEIKTGDLIVFQMEVFDPEISDFALQPEAGIVTRDLDGDSEQPWIAIKGVNEDLGTWNIPTERVLSHWVQKGGESNE